MKYTNYLIINNFYIQVQRIWINGIGHYEPGFDQLVSIQQGNLVLTDDRKVNGGINSMIDALRSVQKNWATQGQKKYLLMELLKQFTEVFSSLTGMEKLTE